MRKAAYTFLSVLVFTALFSPTMVFSQVEELFPGKTQIELGGIFLSGQKETFVDPIKDGPVLGRIVGGVDADIKNYSWQVALTNTSYQQFCGGSVIDKNWILTAAHCLENVSSPGLIRIRSGVTNRLHNTGQDRQVSEIILHPDYSNNGYRFDAALVRLATPLDLTDPNVSKIPLVTPIWGIQGVADPGAMAAITGWGATSYNGPSSNILQVGFVPVVSNGEANNPSSYGGGVRPEMIAAGFLGVGGVDACQGDSGGPLAVPDPASPVGYRLAGITSFGVECGAPNYPGVYARVSAITDWIEETTGIFVGQGPAPKNFTAEISGDENHDVALSWEPPDISVENWFFYNQDFTNLGWAGPERATKFDLTDFYLQYPLYVTKVSHMFFQHSSYPWPSDQFRFKIYNAEGDQLLYESSPLTAAHLIEYVYELDEPLLVTEEFFVAVDPEDSSNHPSSLMLGVSETNSYSGSAGNWTPLNNFELYMGVFISQGNDGDKDPETIQFLGGYEIFRNGTLMQTIDDPETLDFSDLFLIDGGYSYEVGGILAGRTSDKTPPAEVEIATGNCDPVVNFPFSETFSFAHPPACWTATETSSNTWQQASGYVVGSGINASHIYPVEGHSLVYVQWTDQEQQDEWLITPELNLADMEHPVLQFYFNGSYQWSVINDNCDLVVLLSADGENWTQIWKEEDHPDFTSNEVSYVWLRTLLSLDEVAGEESVWIAFRYEGEDGANFAIDHVAVYEGMTFEVTLAAGEGGTTDPEPGTYTLIEGSSFSTEALPEPGFVFEHWEVGEETITDNPLNVEVAQDVLITAVFSAIPQYILSIEIVGEGSISPEPGDYSYEEGSQVEISAADAGMWIFQFWTINNQENAEPSLTLTMDQDITAVATFLDVTGIDEIISEDGFRLYPNPANDRVNIRIDEEAGTTHLVVTNVKGQLVYSRRIPAGQSEAQLEISTGQWLEGLYLVRVTNDKGMFSRLLVISR